MPPRASDGTSEAGAQLGPVLAAVISGHLAATVAEAEHRTGRRASAENLEPAVFELVERGRRASAIEHLDAVARLRDLQRSIETCFDDCDVLLTPTTAQPAPALGVLRTDQPVADLFGQIVALAPFTGLFNVTGGPR